jgi:hypothetical protein
MKQPASQQHGERQGQSARSGQHDLETGARSPLTEEERRVLHCLSDAGTGLTARQVESRSACSGEALERALAGLLEHRLIARLNTIVPSYTARTASPIVDDR